MEPGAIAEIVRPHGDDHVNRDFALAGAGKKQRDKRIGLVGRDPLVVAENFRTDR